MPNENHEHVTEWIPAYALGILDAAELAAVERHLQRCAVCRAELAAHESIVDVLPLAAVETMPAADLKGRLMTRVRQEKRSETAVSSASPWWQPVIDRIGEFFARPRWQPALALVTLVVLVGALVVWQQSELSSLNQIELTATDVAPEAHGLIEVAQNGYDATLKVAGLPSLTAEQQYQLWLIIDDQRISGAIFSVDADGAATVTVDTQRPLTEYKAFGITIEPAGGSLSPTGERVLGGNI